MLPEKDQSRPFVFFALSRFHIDSTAKGPHAAVVVLPPLAKIFGIAEVYHGVEPLA